MEFSSFSEFLAMGKHGFYVWLSYGLTALIVAFNVLQPWLRRRQLIKQHTQRLRREKKHAPST
ncbi:heme exporter protein CcmD [Bacterioplanes sanyensis]|uniref:Heme exporter protein D n=1 Tax=Bacterioplanes sanyensis TaxID=1249553 RepID=A0A222FPS4_9GAMM|nr:heme exporter protein CcmD [Bacterioplanes sanyensis]ASP40243.1 heme exporter protein CcmD [Bacterioplanes sanyensis]